MPGLVRVIAPDGQAGEIPEDQASEALASGFTLADAGPSAPAPQADEGHVSVVAPDGQLGEVPRSQLQEALASGFTTPKDTSVLGAVAAFAEGAAQGASLGMQTPLAALEGVGMWLGSGAPGGLSRGAAFESMQQAQRGITEREEAHPYASGAGQVAGIVLPAVATGGSSIGATAAAGGGSALLGRSAVAIAGNVAARVSPTAARGLLAPAARLLTQGAIEGAAYGAAKEVDDAFIAGDYEGLAEKTAWGAARGAGLGGALSLAGGALIGGAKKTVEAATRLARNLAEESAFKAVVGRTSQAAHKLAARQGGGARVGRTLLEAEMPLASSPEMQFAGLSEAADEVGKTLGALAKSADELGAGGPTRSAIISAVDDQVLAPLRANPFAQDIVASAEAKLTPFRDLMTRVERPVIARGRDGAERLVDRDAISFDELRALRIKLDDTLRYESAGPPTPVTQVLRDVRNVVENAWLDQAESAASSVGQPGFAAKMTALKQRYAHLALARDQAHQAAITQSANRSVSLTDTIAGAGAAGVGGLAGGPMGALTGVATAIGHKIVRERGRGIMALTLDRLAKDATAAQLALNNSATLKGLFEGGARAMKLGTVEAVDDYLEASQPGAPARMEFEYQIEQLRNEEPLLADAMQAQQARADAFISTKIPPATMPDAFGARRARDPEAAAEAAAYIHAAQDPFSAVSRVSDGTASRQDVETLMAVYPRIYAELRQKAIAKLADAKHPPTYDQRLRIARVLGIEADTSPDHGVWLQELAAGTRKPQQEQPQPSPGRARNYKARGEDYLSRADRVAR